MPYRTVTSGLIVDKTIATADLADDAVTGAKIADKTIATADLADDAVTAAKIAACTIEDANIARGTITGAALTDPFKHPGAVCAPHLHSVCFEGCCGHFYSLWVGCGGAYISGYSYFGGLSAKCIDACVVYANRIEAACSAKLRNLRTCCSAVLPGYSSLECEGSIYIGNCALCYYSGGAWRKVSPA